MSKKHWHDNDWYISFIVSLALASGIVCNYFFHGGHLVW
jgi:hypothetical protein